MLIKWKRKELGIDHESKNPNSIYRAHENNEPIQLYSNNKLFPIIKTKFSKMYMLVTSFIASFIFGILPVSAVEKIEGGNVTIDSLGTIIKDLATKVQIYGIVLAFIALVIFVIQFIIGDDETKQRRKKTILYTLGGVALLILVPSIINFVIDTLE